MTKTIGFISEKGGTGKTTTCYHVATALAYYHKKRVLVLDADYQRGGITGRFFPNLIETFNQPNKNERTLFHHFQELYSAAPKDLNIHIQTWNNYSYSVDAIPADPRLSSVSTDKLPGSNNIRENNLALLSHLQVVHDALEPLKPNYDFILIDSHPEVSDVLKAVIYASDFCVSPVKLDRQSSIGVATVIGAINDVNDDVSMINATMNGVIDFTPTVFSGSIGTMAREYNGILKETERLEYRKLARTSAMFKHYITEGDGLRQAALDRCPVYDLSFENAYKQSRQYKNVTKELISTCC